MTSSEMYFLATTADGFVDGSELAEAVAVAGAEAGFVVGSSERFSKYAVVVASSFSAQRVAIVPMGISTITTRINSATMIVSRTAIGRCFQKGRTYVTS